MDQYSQRAASVMGQQEETTATFRRIRRELEALGFKHAAANMRDIMIARRHDAHQLLRELVVYGRQPKGSLPRVKMLRYE